jgi:hypothetical protein
MPAIEQRQDVRMLQRCRGLDLYHEAIGADDSRKLGFEQLQRDLSSVLEIFAQVDRRHPGFTEVAFHAVPAGQGRVEAVGLLRHRAFFASFSVRTVIAS